MIDIYTLKMLNIFVYIQQFIGICFQEDNTETVPEVPQEEEAVEETPCEVSYLMSVCVYVCLCGRGDHY